MPDFLTKNLPSEIHIHTAPQWERRAIRAFLYEKFQHEDLLNLAKPPQCPGVFISVSHAPGLGGVVWGCQPVGLDIEVKTRVQPAVIARISTQSERLSFYKPEFLWPIKEAVWKTQGLGVITDVMVTKVWDLKGGLGLLAKIHGKSVSGLCCQRKDYLFCVAWVSQNEKR